ncbi:MAG: YtxH domain-containing protein [Dehalococcoidia bacterium]|nr:YtxH domain-containing protein [Dehalococcoidia bacterium]
MGNNDNGGSFALGLLVGGIIGALIGMLLAPKPGSETRSEIWERSETLRSRADEAAASLRERVGPAADGVSSRFGPAVESVREAGASAIENVNARLGRGQEEAEVVEPDSDVTTTQSSNGQETPS